MAAVQRADPDVIENHNLHGFDLPFLDHRARALRVPLTLGRTGASLLLRAARRGRVSASEPDQRVRLVAPGRELIDTIQPADDRDYDVEHYRRILREMYAARLVRAFTAEDFTTVFAEPDQLSLFPASIGSIQSVLTRLAPHGPVSG